jgi:hypothetical protein
MIFMKFEIEGSDPMFFVGSSEEAILEDTHNGIDFGGFELKNHKIITKEEAYIEKPKYFGIGVKTIKDGTTNSFYL